MQSLKTMSKIIIQPTILGSSRVTASAELGIGEARWLRLVGLNWTDQTGKERKWEMAERRTTSKSGVDAVAIVALLRHPSRPLSIPIILQYRPPVDQICVELPAGLIDEEEGPGESAMRELVEETGYGGDAAAARVASVGQIVLSDPGMSRASMQLVTIEVDLKEGEEAPIAKLEDGEHIEVRITPLAELFGHLQAYGELGYAVDARLYHYAAGIDAAQRLSL